jgi:hypothetical protein
MRFIFTIIEPNIRFEMSHRPAISGKLKGAGNIGGLLSKPTWSLIF